MYYNSFIDKNFIHVRQWELGPIAMDECDVSIVSHASTMFFFFFSF